MEKKYRAPFSFRQTQKFKNNKGKIDFSILCAKTEHFKNEKEIKVKGRLIKDKRLRSLEEEISSPIDIDCTAKTITTDPVEFGCSLIGDPNTNGIIIFDSEELSGIPNSKLLTNPSEVDNLILAGKEKDCSTQDCSLPTFSEGKLDNSLCDEGIINIKGEIDGDITDGSIFNLDISPESYGDCNISINTKTIECYNKEEIEDNKIIIPETIIRNKDSNVFSWKWLSMADVIFDEQK